MKNRKNMEQKWIMVQKTQTRGILHLDQVAITFYDRTASGRQNCSIKLGLDVLKKVGYKIGDKISIFYCEDDLKSWKLAPHHNGYTLCQEKTNLKCKKLSFSWREMDFGRVRTVIVPHTIMKDQIMLDLSEIGPEKE